MTSQIEAIALVSGGMDSLVTLAVALETYRTAALHVRYGQRTQEREEKAFHDITAHYGITETLITDIPALGKIGGSGLTDTSIDLPDADLQSEGIPVSYVPFRNAHFLTIAVSWAEAAGARKLFIGAVEEDSSGYPDCRREFYDAFEKTIESGTKPGTDISIVTPVIDMKKYEIIRKATDLQAPLHLTWSCYRDSDIACGTCDSCALRLRAFRQAGVDDPIPYRERPGY